MLRAVCRGAQPVTVYGVTTQRSAGTGGRSAAEAEEGLAEKTLEATLWEAADRLFIEAVCASIATIEGANREGTDTAADLDVEIMQIVSEYIAGNGVIDIDAEAGVEQPDLSLIDEDFIDKFRRSDRPNLHIEMRKRLLSDEIKTVSRRNVIAGRTFSDMLANSVLRYQNHALGAAAVVADLVALAKQLKREHDRGAQLGLREDELAYYDAVCQDDSAVLELGDEVLKKIARELVDSVRRNATIDWKEKEQVRARMRATIRRLPSRYGYPPDKQPAAIEPVMHPAEFLAGALSRWTSRAAAIQCN